MLDIGSSTVRAGYAGDDTPKAVFSTSYGYVPKSQGEDVAMQEANEDNTTNNSSTEKPKLYIGQHGPSMYRRGMEVATPLQDGLSTLLFPLSKEESTKPYIS